MTLHDRDWIALTLKWLVITGGAFMSIVAVYFLISPDDISSRRCKEPRVGIAASRHRS
jgi:hypothetical protein